MKELANFANDKTDRLRETANKGGKGVQTPENFANVINGCPLMRMDEEEEMWIRKRMSGVIQT